MSMSDTVVVLNRGRIEQIGHPEDIYRAPRSAFVGDFIGESNLLAATVGDIAPDGRLRVRLDVGGTAAARGAGRGQRPPPRDAVPVLIRAEGVRLGPPQAAGDWFAGIVAERSFLGAATRLYLKAESGDGVVIADLAGTPPSWAEIGTRVQFGWAAEDALAYPAGAAP